MRRGIFKIRKLSRELRNMSPNFRMKTSDLSREFRTWLEILVPIINPLEALIFLNWLKVQKLALIKNLRHSMIIWWRWIFRTIWTFSRTLEMSILSRQQSESKNFNPSLLSKAWTKNSKTWKLVSLSLKLTTWMTTTRFWSKKTRLWRTPINSLRS